MCQNMQPSDDTDCRHCWKKSLSKRLINITAVLDVYFFQHWLSFPRFGFLRLLCHIPKNYGGLKVILMYMLISDSVAAVWQPSWTVVMLFSDLATDSATDLIA